MSQIRIHTFDFNLHEQTLLVLNSVKMFVSDHKNMSKINWENCYFDLENVQRNGCEFG